jgi:hypothetical protein
MDNLAEQLNSLFNINSNNTEYFEKYKEYYEINKITGSKKELKRIFRSYLKHLGCESFSIFNKNYYMHLGHSEEDAVTIVKNLQSENSKKRHLKYTKTEISKQSAWSIDYWLNKGLSKEDAEHEILKINYSSSIGYSKKDYIDILDNISQKTKNAHKRGDYINSYNKVSKEEIDFFKKISSFLEVKHSTLFINVKNSKLTDKAGYSIDGYINTESGIIGIEYDGLYWHNIEKDDIRDNEIFSCRADIIGIIRISSRFFKNENINKLKNDILNGINEIKSKKRKKIRYY